MRGELGKRLGSAAIEYKVKQGNNTLHLERDFQPQQLNYLSRAKSDCVYHKLSDLDPGMKPFDAFQICGVAAFVVVCWYRPREAKAVYFLPIEKVLIYMKTSLKIKETDAKGMALLTLDLLTTR